MYDIVCPNKNEEKFVEIATKLDTKIMFCYEFSKDFDKIKKENWEKYKIRTACFVNSKNMQKIKADLLIYKADKDFQRVIESGFIDLIIDLENLNEKDGMFQRNSGLNQVLAKVMTKKQIKLGFNFSNIKTKTHLALGRWSQNLKLAKKYKIDTQIATFATKPFEMKSTKDLKSVLTIL